MAPKKDYTPAQMGQAMEAVRKGEKVAVAAKRYGVPRITLYDKVMGKTALNCTMGPSTILSKLQEDLLEKWIKALAERHFPISRDCLLDSVQKITNDQNIPNPFTNDRPGKKWFKSFLKRHPAITEKVPENLTKARDNVSEKDIRNWFKEIQTYLEDNKLEDVVKDPNRVFNADESAFFLSPKPGSVLAKRGEKHLYSSCGDEKDNLTVLFTGNAAGLLAPPMIVFNYERVPKHISSSVNETWAIGKSESGWMCSSTFYEYVTNIFNPWLEEKNIEKPVIFFLDGHKSHLTLHLSKFCSENGIEVIALYPNSTHILQPMDLAVFRPLKVFWKKAINEWKMENLGQNIKKENFAPVLEKAIAKITPDCIKNGFKAGGLCPFGPDYVDMSKLKHREKASVIKSNPAVTEFVKYLESEIVKVFSADKLDLFNKLFFEDRDTVENYLPEEDTALYVIWAKNKEECNSNSSTVDTDKHLTTVTTEAYSPLTLDPTNNSFDTEDNVEFQPESTITEIQKGSRPEKGDVNLKSYCVSQKSVIPEPIEMLPEPSAPLTVTLPEPSAPSTFEHISALSHPEPIAEKRQVASTNRPGPVSVGKHYELENPSSQSRLESTPASTIPEPSTPSTSEPVYKTTEKGDVNLKSYCVSQKSVIPEPIDTLPEPSPPSPFTLPEPSAPSTFEHISASSHPDPIAEKRQVASTSSPGPVSVGKHYELENPSSQSLLESTPASTIPEPSTPSTSEPVSETTSAPALPLLEIVAHSGSSNHSVDTVTPKEHSLSAPVETVREIYEFPESCNHSIDTVTPRKHSAPIEPIVPGTSSHSMDIVTSKKSSLSDALGVSVPSPFKKFLFWPENDNNTKKKRIKREKIPSAVTGKAWQQYYEYKEKEKKKQQEEKDQKAKIRMEKKILKEKAAEEKKKKSTLKRKRKLQVTSSSEESNLEIEYAESGDSYAEEDDDISGTEYTKSFITNSERKSSGQPRQGISKRKKAHAPESSDSDEDVPLHTLAAKSGRETGALKKITKGQHVIVMYEGEYFPGIVEGVNKNQYEVSTMVLSTGHTFRWPDKPDKIWYRNDQIIEKIDEPVRLNNRGFFKIKKMAKYLPDIYD